VGEISLPNPDREDSMLWNKKRSIDLKEEQIFYCKRTNCKFSRYIVKITKGKEIVIGWSKGNKLPYNNSGPLPCVFCSYFEGVNCFIEKEKS